MTLNNPSGAEIMTAENVNHVQVSCSPKFMQAKSDSLIFLFPHLIAPGGDKMRDPGNEVDQQQVTTFTSNKYFSFKRLDTVFPNHAKYFQ